MSAVLPLPGSQLDVEAWLEKIRLQYFPEAVDLIRQSCLLTQQSCEGKLTFYQTSCIEEAFETANILLNLKADHESLCAALLHPTVSYAEIPVSDLEEQFGKKVVHLLSGLEKMQAIEGLSAPGNRGRMVENLREMLLTMVDDVRVVLLKLAHQGCILRHLASLDPLRQREIARRTLEIYAPLANRLGIYELKWQLEDLSFRYLDPFKYNEIANRLSDKRLDREHSIQNFMDQVSTLLQAAQIPHQISGRAKHIYSIYKKMERKQLDYDQVFDQMAVRILVDTIEDCYQCLSLVQSRWAQLPSEFDDYIATPKENGYQSIHLVALNATNKPIEIQIRTHAMHEFNEKGVAAHWAYKEGGMVKSGYEQKINWLRELLAWQQELANKEDLPVELQKNFIADRVFVFTPQGETVSLPLGATPLDFAYHIHSDLGHRCRGAKVNGNIVPLAYSLKMGDKVEILTGKELKPSRDWLISQEGYLTTPRARAKVHSWFKKQELDHNIKAGQAILERELKRLHLKSANLEELSKKCHLKTTEELLAALGSGDLRLNQLNHFLQPPTPSEPVLTVTSPVNHKKGEAPSSASSIHVAGLSNVLTKIAACCKPLPGDSIAGYITRGQGISVHRRNCQVLLKQQTEHPEHFIEVGWTFQPTDLYTAELVIEALDDPYLLKEISSITSMEKIRIRELKIHHSKKRLTTLITLFLELNRIEQLDQLVIKFHQLPNVYDVKRHSS